MKPLSIAGKYQLLRPLGMGGMAEVFLARQTGLSGFEKLVVVKRVLPHLSGDMELVKMLLDEARVAADLRHEGIVDLYEVGEDGGSYFLAMEFVHGETLRRILVRALASGITIPYSHAVEIGVAVARGLGYAHAKKDLRGKPLHIVHRDVTPHNILVAYDGRVKICDFGIAKAAHRATITAPGIVKGKVNYMSPEQAMGQPLDGRSDLYTLAIVLYELTTGRRVYHRGSDAETMRATAEGIVREPSSLVAGYPKPLERVLLKMLAREVEDRYPDGSKVALALEEAAREAGIVHAPELLSAFLRQLFPEARGKRRCWRT